MRHAIQADAGLRDDDRRDGYLLEAELRLKDKNASAERDAFARGALRRFRTIRSCCTRVH